jgi:hypothetical protein
LDCSCSGLVSALHPDCSSTVILPMVGKCAENRFFGAPNLALALDEGLGELIQLFLG